MMVAGVSLARRLENAEALISAGCVKDAAVLQVAGGIAIFAGPGSPLTHAVGLGMQGPVRAEDLETLEAFYRARGASATVDLCPLADATLTELLGRRGYRVTDFNNVLVRSLPGLENGPADPRVREASAGQEHLWSTTVARGFLEKDLLTEDEMDVGRAIWRMPGARCLLGFHNDRAAAAAALNIHQGLASLFADSTVAGFRGVGLHAALIRERLRLASIAGADLAAAATLPGSISQRNFERAGFQVVYTKVIFSL